MSGKGSGRRPAQVDDHVLSNNWAGSLGGKPFEVVYVGGTHDVWCNGVEHERCDGGHYGRANPEHNKTPSHPLKRFVCDCERYKIAQAVQESQAEKLAAALKDKPEKAQPELNDKAKQILQRWSNSKFINSTIN